MPLTNDENKLVKESIKTIRIKIGDKEYPPIELDDEIIQLVEKIRGEMTYYIYPGKE